MSNPTEVGRSFAALRAAHTLLVIHKTLLRKTQGHKLLLCFLTVLVHYMLTKISSYIIVLHSCMLQSFSISAIRSPPLTFAHQSPNVYTFDQQNLILTCAIESSLLNVSYTWFRGDQKLPGSVVNGDGSLIVPNITEGEYASQEGVDYYCIASDNIGFDVAIRSRTVTVYYACE